MKPKKPDDQAAASRRAARMRRLLKVDTAKDPSPLAPNWEHEVGSTLEGKFLGWITRPGRFEEIERIAIIEAPSGRRYSVWCRLTMLKAEFKRTDPQPGDDITITRGTDRDTGKERPLKTFQINVGESNGSPPRAEEKAEGGHR